MSGEGIGVSWEETMKTLGGQALAAARAATGDDFLAVLGGHAQAKAVATFTHQTGRLISALHAKLRVEGLGAQKPWPRMRARR